MTKREARAWAVFALLWLAALGWLERAEIRAARGSAWSRQIVDDVRAMRDQLESIGERVGGNQQRLDAIESMIEAMVGEPALRDELRRSLDQLRREMLDTP
jgi:hypothetical protein